MPHEFINDVAKVIFMSFIFLIVSWVINNHKSDYVMNHILLKHSHYLCTPGVASKYLRNSNEEIQ